MSSNTSWTASPNTTNTTTVVPPWSNVALYVPVSDSSDKRVGFLSDNNTAVSGAVTSGFRFYGSMAALVGTDGQLETLWYSLQVSERVHALYWNDTSLGQTPVVLRSKAPSNPST